MYVLVSCLFACSSVDTLIFICSIKLFCEKYSECTRTICMMIKTKMCWRFLYVFQRLCDRVCVFVCVSKYFISTMIKRTRRYFNLSKCEIANLSFTDIYWIELKFERGEWKERDRDTLETRWHETRRWVEWHKCKSPTTSTIDLNTVQPLP